MLSDKPDSLLIKPYYGGSHRVFLRGLQKFEFFGMAVMEAVRAGCSPFVPDRLAYRELFPEQYRYQDDTLGKELKTVLLDHGTCMRLEDAAEITRRFSWPEIAPSYRAWLLDLGQRGYIK